MEMNGAQTASPRPGGVGAHDPRPASNPRPVEAPLPDPADEEKDVEQAKNKAVAEAEVQAHNECFIFVLQLVEQYSSVCAEYRKTLKMAESIVELLQNYVRYEVAFKELDDQIQLVLVGWRPTQAHPPISSSLAVTSRLGQWCVDHGVDGKEPAEEKPSLRAAFSAAQPDLRKKLWENRHGLTVLFCVGVAFIVVSCAL